MMSFVASCRLNGRTLFFIERITMNFDDAEVVLEESGEIPTFSSEADALAEIARRFPLRRTAQLTEDSSEEELAAAMEDNYAKHIKLAYDLDAVRAWAQSPGPQGITPDKALDAWELCWQVGEAPRPQRFDPMGMYAIHENMMREPERREAYEILMLGMKLSGIVLMAREGRKPADWKYDWPEMAEFWPETDYGRLSEILKQGIEGFARRVL